MIKIFFFPAKYLRNNCYTSPIPVRKRQVEESRLPLLGLCNEFLQCPFMGNVIDVWVGSQDFHPWKDQLDTNQQPASE